MSHYSLVVANTSITPYFVMIFYETLIDDLHHKRFDDSAFHRTFFIGRSQVKMCVAELQRFSVGFDVFEEFFVIVIPHRTERQKTSPLEYQKVLDEIDASLQSDVPRPKRFFVSSETYERLAPVLEQKGIIYHLIDRRWSTLDYVILFIFCVLYIHMIDSACR